MQTRPYIIIALVIIGGLILIGTFAGGMITGGVVFSGPLGANLGFDRIAKSGSSDAGEYAETPDELLELFEPFWQSWDVVHQQYVDQPVNDEQLMRGAISGMMDSLGDAHTSYLDPDLQERFEAALNGQEYEGIGAWVDTGGEYLTIISPMPGSPAEKAGLFPGDQIIAIDGEDMTGIDPEIARQSVLGPKDSIVVLTIQREGIEEPFDVTIKRASIVVPTIEGEIIEGENLAYIRLYTFGGQTSNDMRDILKDLLEENPDGLILDLRNNGGGYLQTAIEVVSEFIGDGVVMYEEHGDGMVKEYKAQRGGIATDIPVVILINEGSASASEIVAGAIQDRDRGVLVGITSFGKGSVQTITNLENDQGQIRVTTARWLTPSKRQINGIGLEPDYIIELTDEDFNAGLDPQLAKAIELLRN